MATATKSFKGDVDKMEKTLTTLSKNKVTLKMDLSKAKAELKVAEKQFNLTHSAADGLKLELLYGGAIFPGYGCERKPLAGVLTSRYAPEDTDCIAWRHLLCQKNSLLTRLPVEHRRAGRYSPAL